MNEKEEAAFAMLQQLDPKEAVAALKKRGAEIRREFRRELMEEAARAWDEEMRGDNEPLMPDYFSRWLRQRAKVPRE